MTLTHCTPVAFLFTRDRQKAAAFFRDVLGLTFMGSDPYSERFDMRGVELRLVPIADHTPSPHTVLGWEVDDIAATMHTLRANGVTFQIYDGFGQEKDGVWASPDGKAKIAWFLDPDGNNLSIAEHQRGE